MTNPERHAEASSNESKLPVRNPVTSSLNVVVSVPDSIEIRMVDASALSDYEVWFFMSSILASAVIGFLVAFVQGKEANTVNANQLGFTTLVFAVLFVVCTITTFVKRSCLRKKGRSIRLKATDEVAE